MVAAGMGGVVLPKGAGSIGHEQPGVDGFGENLGPSGFVGEEFNAKLMADEGVGRMHVGVAAVCLSVGAELLDQRPPEGGMGFRCGDVEEKGHVLADLRPVVRGSQPARSREGQSMKISVAF
ncbi:MAG: hypothetical protein RLZZ440_3073 [Planctomycetota bacterium]